MAILANYDLMLFPTHHFDEGFLGVLVDAMFAGIPVIATDWRYSSEIIKEGYNGYIVPINQPEAIADKILFLHNNKDILLNMQDNCLREAPKYLSLIHI